MGIGGKGPRIKGAAFERKAKADLIKKGFFAVKQGRSAFPDLLAVKAPLILFVECKCNKYISGIEKRDLLNLEIQYGGKAIIAYNNKGKVSYCNLEYKEIKPGC